MAQIHSQMHNQHGTLRFLPWHRIFLYLLENELASIHPDVTLPYWDWTQAGEQTFPAWLSGFTPTVTNPEREYYDHPQPWHLRRPCQLRLQHARDHGAYGFRYTYV